EVPGISRVVYDISASPRRPSSGSKAAKIIWSGARADDFLQPGHQVLHMEGSRLDELDHMVVNRLRVCGDRIAVDSQKDVDHSKRNSLVAIHKGMVLKEAFQERGSLVNERVVVTGLRPMKG